MSNVILSVMGTAQDGGLPHPNCFCENCSRALNDPTFRRTASALAIVLPEEKKWHLIDATPDLKEQMSKLQMKFQLEGKIMSSIFFTHAHMGHIPGLLFLGKEGMNTNNVPVFAGEKLKNMLENNAPWQLLTKLDNILLKDIRNDEEVKIDDRVSVTPVIVPHRNEFSETFAFWINGPNKKVLYIPDIDRWEEWETDILDECKNADICLLDGTFHSPKDLEHIGRDFKEVPHPLMTTTMEKLQDLTDQTKIYFTHLNHSNRVIVPDSNERKELLERGFYIAEEGMEFSI
ncbi:MBL fold metallo-hydrolase [Ornithinibacillus californiensis]|uniref:MBL fold metallo-hydrolase n=1 Tax=Ornithinibacillus californiensis TaxID=161536 RepID=UPI00069DEF0F|nr:MBL fold metallo-hydrolase [Ornithinibacillus californiensis]